MSRHIALRLLLLRFGKAAGMPLLACLLGLLFLLLPPQTRDLLVGMGAWHAVLFHLSVGLWAVTVWHWSRWSLSLVPAYRPETDESAGVSSAAARLRVWLPRVPLLLTLPAVLIPVLRSPESGVASALHVLLAALVALALIWLVRRRNAFVPVLAGPAAASGVRMNHNRLVDLRECVRLFPLGPAVALAWPVAFVLLSLAFGLVPVTAGAVLGAPATAFLGLAALTGTVSLAAGLLRRNRGLPAWLVIGIVLALGGAGHSVRTLSDALQAGGDASHYRLVANRPPLMHALDHWRENCAEESPRGPRLLIVATAGGASRAALWTAEVLHRLEGEAPAAFRQALFAISGVSGGSLGAAAYVAGLAEGCRTGAEAPVLAARRELVRQALTTEMLAPPIGALLTTDMLSRILPFVNLPDRAAALEQAFEAAWDGAARRHRPAGTTGSLDEPFLALWMRGGDPAGPGPHPSWHGGRPMLMLNGTLGETGVPVLTAPVRVTQDQFPFALDALNLLGRDLRLSTAVTNSARFPVVSPAGVLVGRDGRQAGAVVDGGYTENFGADTARDLVRAVAYWHADRVERAGRGELPGPGSPDPAEPARPPAAPRVLVVQVSSDPSLPRASVPRCGPRPERFLPATTADAPPGVLDSLVGPLTAVLAARGARGARTAGDLAREFCADHENKERPLSGRLGQVQTNYAHLALCDEDVPGEGAQERVIGLNWALTEAAANFLAPSDPDAARAMSSCGNAAEFRRISRWLTGTDPDAGEGGAPSARPADAPGVTPAGNPRAAAAPRSASRPDE